ncbi:MAG: class I SAM-dependent methyltransferase [Candidatus Bathyarchaeia archaeon]|nr:class I SAM-dependent methyltransferase [Candidatus Bathyarchaeia archaeon]
MDQDELISKERWNEIYRREIEREESTLKVDEDLRSVVDLFKKRNVRRVLDLGCGAGRHIVYLAREGFDVYGIDISEEGIKKAKQRLAEMNLHANLKVGSMFTILPYHDNFFDAVISIKTIHHGKIRQIRKAIKEIERVLKPGGLIFIIVPKKRSKKEIPKERLFGIKFIAPRTYTILCGEEKGVPHYQFNKELLRKNFRSFKILNLYVNKNGSYCLLGELRK